MNNVEKLPKWAQAEIADLESRVADAERLAEDARLATDPASTNTYVEPYFGDRIGLPNGERVVFRVTDPVRGFEQKVYVRVQNGSEGPYLALHADGGALVITPVVTNVINLRVARS